MAPSVAPPYFRPFHTAHAIVEMVAFYEFARQTPSTQDQLVAALEDLSRLFGPEFIVQPLQINEVEANDNGVAFRTFVGYAVQKGGQPNQPEWLIRIDTLGFSIHVLNYTRWDIVHAEVRRLSAILLGHAATRPLDLSGLGLRYLDQFNFVGDAKAYDASLLFNSSSHIQPKAFSSGPRWHCHTGWFNENTPEVLNQLNLNSLLPPPEMPPKPCIVIEHVQTVRQQPGAQWPDYLRAPKSAADRDALMQGLHESNKLVMADLLRADVARQINLVVKKAVA